MEEPPRIADADAALGRAFPLPQAQLPLARWVDVTLHEGGAEIAWALDDSRAGTPGRIALFAGTKPAPARDFPQDAKASTTTIDGRQATVRSAPLAEAEPSLRPVTELSWSGGDLHLRLTAQGAWTLDQLVAIAASIPR